MYCSPLKIFPEEGASNRVRGGTAVTGILVNFIFTILRFISIEVVSFYLGKFPLLRHFALGESSPRRDLRKRVFRAWGGWGGGLRMIRNCALRFWACPPVRARRTREGRPPLSRDPPSVLAEYLTLNCPSRTSVPLSGRRTDWRVGPPPALTSVDGLRDDDDRTRDSCCYVWGDSSPPSYRRRTSPPSVGPPTSISS